MDGEHTDPAMRIPRPLAVERDNVRSFPRPSALKTWGMIAGVIVATGGAGAVVYKAIAWPWEAKAAATKEHAAIRLEVKAGDDAIRAELEVLKSSQASIDAKLEAMPAKTAGAVVDQLKKIRVR